MRRNCQPPDLGKLKTTSIFERHSKVNIAQFCKLPAPSPRWREFLNSLPKALAGVGLRDLVNAIVKARRRDRHVIFAMGAHIIKCGLSPVVLDLMKRGVITAIAATGATAVHDYEISLAGRTSEDVQLEIERGTFGTTRETAEALAKAALEGAAKKIGFGKALGELIMKSKNPHRNLSILAAGARLGIPVTIHVAFGTDIFHIHDCLDPAALGVSTHIDFRILCGIISQLEGGVYLNIGSAVVLPEVFLKALACARARGARVKNFTTGNMDMIRHYRAEKNVVERPQGRGISIVGHHEINLPLLRLLILSNYKGSRKPRRFSRGHN
jgi:hypothetical protein